MNETIAVFGRIHRNLTERRELKEADDKDSEKLRSEVLAHLDNMVYKEDYSAKLRAMGELFALIPEVEKVIEKMKFEIPRVVPANSSAREKLKKAIGYWRTGDQKYEPRRNYELCLMLCRGAGTSALEDAYWQVSPKKTIPDEAGLYKWAVENKLVSTEMSEKFVKGAYGVSLGNMKCVQNDMDWDVEIPETHGVMVNEKRARLGVQVTVEFLKELYANMESRKRVGEMP
ncbi:MAG: hypothetical protein AB1468_00215 [Candidatus Micrarchaeota archaeon]